MKTGKKNMEENNKEKQEFTLDVESIMDLATVNNTIPVQQPIMTDKATSFNKTNDEDKPLINCLRNEIVEIKFVPQPGTESNPKHVMYGGMAENSRVTLCVPKLRSGLYVDVLTKEEKRYLEHIMGLAPGAMSIYNKVDNFWSSNSDNGISTVILHKFDNRLDLSNPVQYVQYKILLANKDIIAPDLQTLRDKPKATYRFVIVSDTEVSNESMNKLNIKKQCYMEFGKIENNKEMLRAVIEIITAKPLSVNTSLEYLQTKIGELIDTQAKLFLHVIKDPLLPTRILIKKCIEQGFISKKGDYLYLRSDNTPLCEGGEEPTMTMAAKYLSSPKRQTMKLSLEAMLKQ